mmetsp:Transcript_17287/g.44287  ORF Transcript_17287/g.44287 Transcript_17287/m.44287 type:complete len:277 (-) Transcript_17287:467-1297(-)
MSNTDYNRGFDVSAAWVPKGRPADSRSGRQLIASPPGLPCELERRPWPPRPRQSRVQANVCLAVKPAGKEAVVLAAYLPRTADIFSASPPNCALAGESAASPPPPPARPLIGARARAVPAWLRFSSLARGRRRMDVPLPAWRRCGCQVRTATCAPAAPDPLRRVWDRSWREAAARSAGSPFYSQAVRSCWASSPRRGCPTSGRCEPTGPPRNCRGTGACQTPPRRRCSPRSRCRLAWSTCGCPSTHRARGTTASQPRVCSCARGCRRHALVRSPPT